MGFNDSLEWPLQQLHDSLRHRLLCFQGEKRGEVVSTLWSHVQRWVLTLRICGRGRYLPTEVSPPYQPEKWQYFPFLLSLDQCVISRNDVWQLPGNLFIGPFSRVFSSPPSTPLTPLNFPSFLYCSECWCDGWNLSSHLGPWDTNHIQRITEY